MIIWCSQSLPSQDKLGTYVCAGQTRSFKLAQTFEGFKRFFLDCPRDVPAGMVMMMMMMMMMGEAVMMMVLKMMQGSCDGNRRTDAAIIKR